MTTKVIIFATQVHHRTGGRSKYNQQGLPQAHSGCRSMHLFLKQISQNLFQHLFLKIAANYLTNFGIFYGEENIILEK